MMQSVAVVSRKGGSGKTTSAHLLALGAVWNDLPAYVFHTDDREPLAVNGRPYEYRDARKVDVLRGYYNHLMGINAPGLIVIDSGGNRPKFDAWLGEHVDLVLIPVQLDEEDIEVALHHGPELAAQGARVRYVVNRCPGRLSAYDEQLLARLPGDQVIGRVGEVRASRLLRASDPAEGFTTPATPVNNAARHLYRLIRDELSVS
jgi:hypothetical protein